MEGLQENIKRLRERINALELALADPKVTIDKTHSIYVLERAKLLLDEFEFKFYEFIDSTEYITQKVNEEIKNLE
jgi:hypothetical protein